MRKTIDVLKMLEWGNKQLARTDEYANKEAFKAGICSMLENLLMETGNYMGYNYINGGETKYCRYYYISNNLT